MRGKKKKKKNKETREQLLFRNVSSRVGKPAARSGEASVGAHPPKPRRPAGRQQPAPASCGSVSRFAPGAPHRRTNPRDAQDVTTDYPPWSKHQPPSAARKTKTRLELRAYGRRNTPRRSGVARRLLKLFVGGPSHREEDNDSDNQVFSESRGLE